MIGLSHSPGVRHGVDLRDWVSVEDEVYKLEATSCPFRRYHQRLIQYSLLFSSLISLLATYSLFVHLVAWISHLTMHFSTFIAVTLAYAAGSVSAAKAVAPSSIQAFNPNAPAGLTTNYQPLLKVTMGCVPFPAVDLAEGGRFRSVKPSLLTWSICFHQY